MDNTYMLFSETCGWETYPKSFKTVTTSKNVQPVSRISRIQNETLQKLSVDFNQLKAYYSIIYDHLKDKLYGNDYATWRYILLCLHTSIRLIDDVIVNSFIIVSKNIAVSIINVFSQVYSIIKFIFEIVKMMLFSEGNLKERMINVQTQIYNKFNTYEFLGILTKFTQNIAFLLSLNSLYSGSKKMFEANPYDPQKELSKQELKERPTLFKVLNRSKDNFFTTSRYLSVAVNGLGRGISALSSTLIGKISQAGISVLKYTLSSIRSKIGVKKGTSFIWDKFEGIVDSLGESVDRFTEDSIKKLEKMSYSIKSRFEMAKVILSVPSMLISISQIFIFWMGYFSIDNLTILNSIFNMLRAATDSQISGMSPIMIVFLMTIFLKILGSVWNIVQYNVCKHVNCETIEGTTYIDLEKRSCADQCWESGVEGISSIFVPAVVTKEILEKLTGLSISDEMKNTVLLLINANNAVSSKKPKDFLLKQINASEIFNRFNSAVKSLSGDDYFFHLQG